MSPLIACHFVLLSVYMSLPFRYRLDSAGITLSQRKNQLNRRLRKTKLLLQGKETKGEEEEEEEEKE